MSFTLAHIASHPENATYRLPLHELDVAFRPLVPADDRKLASFLEVLSPQTQERSTFDSYDLRMAQELCDAISKYDKLRMVVEIEAKIVGLIEFSFDIPDSDIKRYRDAGVELDQKTDCRFGLTLSDEYQGRGLGSALFPYIKEVAAGFGKKRIILWGGVLADNSPAIRYYEKNGFSQVGNFVNSNNKASIDMILSIAQQSRTH